MHISRIQIQNFRNFANLDVNVGQHAVIVGENKIGKSNLLHALRLVLDPSLPDSARKLREEDFWDGLDRPLGEDDRITISVNLTDFEDDENQLAVLAEHLVEPEPMVARLTYVWQPRGRSTDVRGRRGVSREVSSCSSSFTTTGTSAESGSRPYSYILAGNNES